MRRTFLGFGMSLALVALAACVDVPDSIHAQFAGAGPNDTSNYRPGKHGVVPPGEHRLQEAPDAAAAPATASDGGVYNPAAQPSAAPMTTSTSDAGTT